MIARMVLSLNGSMMNDNRDKHDIQDIILSIEELKREARRQGWQDAISAMQAALNQAMEDPPARLRAVGDEEQMPSTTEPEDDLSRAAEELRNSENPLAAAVGLRLS